MRSHMRNSYRALVITVVFLSLAQSVPEMPADIAAVSEAFEIPKPQINLTRINLTNEIFAIETANNKWYAPNSRNMPNLEEYAPSEGDHVIYQIIVSNMDSNNSLKQIHVVDELPEGMIYISSSMDNEQSIPEVSGNKITWKIDIIEPNTHVLIKHVAAFHRMNDLRRFENKAYAKGIWDTEYALIEDQSQVVSSVLPL